MSNNPPPDFHESRQQYWGNLYAHESEDDSHTDVTVSAPSAAADAAVAFDTAVNEVSSATAATASEAPLKRDEAEFGALGVVASPPPRIRISQGWGMERQQRGWTIIAIPTGK
jgi:hypothetical protein